MRVQGENNPDKWQSRVRETMDLVGLQTECLINTPINFQVANANGLQLQGINQSA